MSAAVDGIKAAERICKYSLSVGAEPALPVRACVRLRSL